MSYHRSTKCRNLEANSGQAAGAGASRLFLHKAFVVAFPVCLFCLFESFGCSYAPQNGDAETSDAIDSLSVDSGLEHSSTRESGLNSASSRLSHHLGIIQPGTIHNPRFAIHNTTDTSRRLDKLGVSCSCTVPTIEWDSISPGGVEYVDVEYRASAQSGDYSKSVLVYFAGERDPLRLEVSAHVRAPLVCSHTVLEWNVLSPEESPSTRISIANYSDSDWSDLAVDSSEAWLSAIVEPVSPLEVSPEAPPRQSWLIDIIGDLKHVSAGSANAHIAISALPANAETYTLPVKVIVASPIVMSRRAIFFDDVTLGQSSQETVTLSLRDPRSHQDLRLVEYEHNLGDELDVTVNHLSTSSIAVELQFNAAELGVTRGRIMLTVPGLSVEPVMLPVIAIVHEPR